MTEFEKARDVEAAKQEDQYTPYHVHWLDGADWAFAYLNKNSLGHRRLMEEISKNKELTRKLEKLTSQS